MQYVICVDWFVIHRYDTAKRIVWVEERFYNDCGCYDYQCCLN